MNQTSPTVLSLVMKHGSNTIPQKEKVTQWHGKIQDLQLQKKSQGNKFCLERYKDSEMCIRDRYFPFSLSFCVHSRRPREVDKFHANILMEYIVINRTVKPCRIHCTDNFNRYFIKFYVLHTFTTHFSTLCWGREKRHFVVAVDNGYGYSCCPS